MPPRAALKTVTVAVSGTAVRVVSGEKGVAQLLDEERRENQEEKYSGNGIRGFDISTAPLIFMTLCIY